MTEKLTSELKVSMDSPFSNYLSRKRPNWDNIDMTLFHKIVNIKSNAIWHTIQREKADIRLNAIINILVRSALDASAGKLTREVNIESDEMKHLKHNMQSIVNRIKTLKTLKGESLDECEETPGQNETDPKTLKEYRQLQSRQKRCRRDINFLQQRIKNVTYATRNSIMCKALKRGNKEGFQMVSETIKPKKKKGTKTLPETMVYNGKTYKGAETLEGFYDVAADLAKDPQSNIDNTLNPNKLYKLQTDVVQIEEFLIGRGKTKVRKLNDISYDALLKSLAKGKSPNIMGSQVE